MVVLLCVRANASCDVINMIRVQMGKNGEKEKNVHNTPVIIETITSWTLSAPTRPPAWHDRLEKNGGCNVCMEAVD